LVGGFGCRLEGVVLPSISSVAIGVLGLRVWSFTGTVTQRVC
jgi:hypothetical protein